MDNGFDRACPSGNIMVELSGGEPPPYSNECITCRKEEGHYCRECGEEITEEQCENLGGLCEVCQEAIDEYKKQ